MYGAIIGDVVGSIYEWHNIKTKEFPLFRHRSFPTDDTFMTIAVAHACSRWREFFRRTHPEHIEDDLERFRDLLVREMHRIGNRYPNAGYGGRFRKWLVYDEYDPYGSYGNGSAMRVSPCGFVARSLDEAELLAEASADVTHDHPEGIKGAQATAAAIYLAWNGYTKDDIRDYIRSKYYPLDKTLDEIRPTYTFDESCQGTVPPAIQAFLESTDFEDAIRNAISLGGDSDTLACITGGIAEAYYGIPKDIKDRVKRILPKYVYPTELEIIRHFRHRNVHAFHQVEADLVKWRMGGDRETQAIGPIHRASFEKDPARKTPIAEMPRRYSRWIEDLNEQYRKALREAAAKARELEPEED